MKILSFDIGIRNMAICCLELNKEDSKVNIIHWDVLNLIELNDTDTHSCSQFNNPKTKKSSPSCCTRKAKFKKNSMVKEIRGLGLMAGINWKNNRDAPENYMGRKKILANKIFANEFSMNFVSECLKRGLIVRPVGPNTVVAPPLCTSKKEVDKIVSIMVESAKHA